MKQLLTNEKVVATLKSIGGNFTHRSALHFAAKTGHADIVALLLQAGADINEMRDEGTPLHMAALYGKSDIVKILLRVCYLRECVLICDNYINALYCSLMH